jgi:hypothetical protein
LVELQGGEFLLNSTPRFGTEVIVIFPPERIMDTLPALDPSETPDSASDGSSEPGSIQCARLEAGVPAVSARPAGAQDCTTTATNCCLRRSSDRTG